LGGVARTQPQPGLSSQRRQAIAGSAVRIVTGAISKAGNRLRLDVWMEDPVSGRDRSVSAAGAEAEGIGPLAQAAAEKLGAADAPFPRTNAAVLRDYFSGLDASTPEEAAALLARAANGDAGFGPAWVAWAEMAIARGDRASGGAILERARANAASFTPLDRARLAVVAAQAANDGAAALAALAALSKLTPNDPVVWRSLGDLAMNGKQAVGAAVAYARAAALQSAEPQVRNLLGYARAAAGDFDGAIQAMREYRALRPNDPNAFDSLGDVYYRFGKFAEAEKAYLEGPAPVFGKAAFARLMTGDLSGANALFAKGASANDPAAELRLASWEFVSGRRAAGLQRIERFAAVSRSELASIAWAHAAVWHRLLGNNARAAEAGRKAVETAAPGSAPIARLCAALAGVNSTPGSPLADAYALLLSRRFADAVPVWKNLHERAGLQPEEDVAVLLAWALIESGERAAAAALLEPSPIPGVSRPNPLQAFTFPRIVYVRARAAEAAGKAEEALRQYRLFLTLSGAEPFIFGEENAAREKLNRSGSAKAPAPESR
jgi:tetratricopeptide (TPR) repeat protein